MAVPLSRAFASDTAVRGLYTTSHSVPNYSTAWNSTNEAVRRSQLYTWELTGHLDSPFQFQYAVFIPLWASLFPLLWQRLEDRKKYEWDTVNFEDEACPRYRCTCSFRGSADEGADCTTRRRSW
eukprot:3577524-Rhodomonas_salina.2